MAADDKSTYTEGSAIPVADVHRARFEYTKEKTALSLENERWKNRRWMAWICLWAVLAVTGLMMFLVPESRLSGLDEVVVWFYVSMASVIGVYIGSATMSDIKSFVGLRRSAAKSTAIETPYDGYAQAADIVDNPDAGDRQ
jgi:hypothetical protein